MANTVVRLFPLLYNIKDFIVRDHPNHHPETQDYIDYWEEQEKRSIEGFWGLDSNGKEGGWRYISGPLYYYINFCVIEDEDEETNASKVINPILRDIEWIFFYNWLICRGFSGFLDDTEFTCNTLVKKLESGELLTTKDKLRLQVAKNITKPDGTYKKYKEPRDILYATYDKPLGKPLYGNVAKNMMGLTSRRQGKSFWLMGIISHTFNFHGAVYFDSNYFNMIKGPEIVVGSVLGKSADMLKKFSFNQEYQKNNYGAYGENDAFIPGWFYQNTQGSLTVSNSKSPYRNEYDYVEGGIWKKGGKGTKIIHVTYQDNPEASVGTGPIISIIEEIGLVANLLDVHKSNETTFIRKNKFGSALYVGTAGNIERILEPKIIFEDPATYDMLEFPDLWENRKKPIGFFLPAYYTDNSFRDENGNQDIEAAYEEEMYQRKIKANADNSLALDGYMMARPLVPSEMFLSATANVFPTAMLRDRLTEVEVKKIYESIAYRGVLEWKDNKQGVRLVPDINNKLKPILQTNLDQYKGNIKGCISFYESPEEDIPDPTRKISLYKVVYDPIKDDGTGTSLASILVYKGVSDNDWALGASDDVVAEYIGRTDLVEDMHEICVKLALYYNAKIMVETNIPDFIRYCKREGRINLLQAKPMDAISRAVKNPGKKYDVGIDMTSPALHEHAEQLIRQWLLTPWKTNKEGVQYLNLHKLKSPRLLLELIQYSRDVNSDHVSSLKLLMLWLSQEKQIPVEKASTAAKETLNSFYNQLKSKQTTNPYYNY